MSFEEALSRLEQAVSRLEEGNIGLADAMTEYEHAVKHLKHCYQLLDRAERRIELLTGVDADGNPISQPFEHEATSPDEARPKTRSPKKQAASRRSSSGGELPGEADDVDESPRLF